MENFVFDMETFVTTAEEQDTDLCPQTQSELMSMRPLYPELAHWTRFAFFAAWARTRRTFMPSAGWTG